MYSDDNALELGDYLAVLMRRKWTVLAVTMLTVTAAMAFSLTRAPTYEGVVELAVEPVRSGQDSSLEEMILGDLTVNTERLVITSRAVTDRVIAGLGIDISPERLLEKVRVEHVNDTRVLRIRATDGDPQRAAKIANLYALSYLEHRHEQAVEALVSTASNLADREETLRADIADLDGQIEAADATQREGLEAQRDSLLTELAQIVSQGTQAQADANLIRGGGQILSPAEPADEPVSPKPFRTGVLALILGLMLGIGVAFLRDHLDDVIRSEDDAKRAGGRLPVMGRIPHSDESQRLVTVVDPTSPHSEAYRGLSASVRFLLAARRDPDDADGDGLDTGTPRGQSVMFTSPDPGDGKTSTAANLAVAAARAGMRVVLLDADMRRPTIHKRFGMPSGVGLSDVIAADVPILDALVDVGIPNLWMLPAGTVPPNPSELLASSRMRALGRYLCAGADLVVIDAPPVLAVSDTLELASFTDASLLVLRARKSRRRTLHHAIERLEGVGASVAGLVINDLDAKSAAYGYYTKAYGDQPTASATAPLPSDGLDLGSDFAVRQPPAHGTGPDGEGFDDPSQLFPVGNRHD